MEPENPINTPTTLVPDPKKLRNLAPEQEKQKSKITETKINTACKTNNDEEPTIPMPFITNIMKAIVPHIRTEFLTSPKLLNDFSVVMEAVSKQQVDEINEYLERLTKPQDLEEKFDDHETQLETKETKTSIKEHVVEPMNGLMQRVKNLAIAQRTQQARKSERLSALEAKKEDLETPIETTFDKKLREAVATLFDDDD